MLPAKYQAARAELVQRLATMPVGDAYSIPKPEETQLGEFTVWIKGVVADAAQADHTFDCVVALYEASVVIWRTTLVTAKVQPPAHPRSN